MTDQRIDEHLDATDRAANEQRIREALPPDWELVRIAEVRGRYAAVFSVEIATNSFKGFGTSWYATQSELLSIVLDTLEHIHLEGEYNVNIFSADMFEYLSAEMLPTGKTVSLTIKSVIQEVIAGPRGESNKVTVSFVERPKKLILNKTNARALAHALGNETDNWRGATVALGVENVKVGRNVVPSVRVKSATPANGPAAHGLIDQHSAERVEAQAAADMQSDLFGAEYDDRQEELKAAALETATGKRD